MRFLLVEAGQTAVRGDEQLRRAYRQAGGQEEPGGGQGNGGAAAGGEVVLDAPQ